MMLRPELSIIIVNYNTKDLLQQCLDSLFENCPPFPWEIIIVDNNSTDGSRNMLAELAKQIEINRPEVRVIFNDQNLGFGRANNQAMRIARGEYFLLLNSDTIVLDQAIAKTLNWLKSHPEFDLIGCRLLNLDRTIQVSAGRFPTLSRVFRTLFLDHFSRNKAIMFDPKRTAKVDWVMGAFMLLRREVFEKSGGFDEQIFMYMEEVEWCYRLKNLGFTVGFYPGAKIIHLGRGSSQGKNSQAIINIYPGLVYFYQKHFSRLKLIVLKIMLHLKAWGVILIGKIFHRQELVETYYQALKRI